MYKRQEGRSLAENYGGIVTARLDTHWSLAAGLFRSIADAPVSYEDLYLNTLPNGSAEQLSLIHISNQSRTSLFWKQALGRTKPYWYLRCAAHAAKAP